MTGAEMHLEAGVTVSAEGKVKAFGRVQMYIEAGVLVSGCICKGRAAAGRAD